MSFERAEYEWGSPRDVRADGPFSSPSGEPTVDIGDGTTGESEPELTLAPIDPVTEAARQRMREVEVPDPAIDLEPVRPRLQFTLRQVLAANVALCVLFALMQYWHASELAGCLGIAAFAVVMAVTLCQVERLSIHVIGWGLYVCYLIVSLVALIQG